MLWHPNSLLPMQSELSIAPTHLMVHCLGTPNNKSLQHSTWVWHLHLLAKFHTAVSPPHQVLHLLLPMASPKTHCPSSPNYPSTCDTQALIATSSLTPLVCHIPHHSVSTAPVIHLTIAHSFPQPFALKITTTHHPCATQAKISSVSTTPHTCHIQYPSVSTAPIILTTSCLWQYQKYFTLAI